MMLRLFSCLIAALALSTAVSAGAEEAKTASADPGAVAAAATPSPADTATLQGELAHLAGFIGNWEIHDKWADGTALWARNEYEVGLGGNFVFARTFAKDGDGEPYERYHTYFSHQGGAWITYGFTNDGTFSQVEAIEVGGEPANASFTSVWGQGGQEIKQTVQLISKDAYSWKVWARPEGGEWFQIMDGTWKRVK